MLADNRVQQASTGASSMAGPLNAFSSRMDARTAANAVVLIIAGIAYFGTLLAQKLTRTNLAEGLGS